MGTKVSETIYKVLADNVVRIHIENGVNMLYKYDDWGMNPYYPSEQGVEFSFYWDAIDTVKTPIGSITFGSMSGTGGCFPKTKDALIEYFGLEFINQRDRMRGERWFIYRATKNIPEEVK